MCPNDANFTFALAPARQPIVFVKHDGAGWVAREGGALTVTREVQFANFADFCNECGNWDVFCPEDGGPYAIKPRFFGSAEDWRRFAPRDGFAIEVVAGVRRVLRRIDGRELAIEAVSEPGGRRMRYSGPGFAVTLDPGDPVATLDGWADGEIDLTPLHILRWIDAAVFVAPTVNYLNAAAPPVGSEVAP